MNTNTNTNTNAWTTVKKASSLGSAAFSSPQTRTMPSAFSSGRSDPARDYRRTRDAEEQAARDAREAREASAKRLADQAAVKRLADAANFESREVYPTLGREISKAPPVMDFKRTVLDMKQREKEMELEAATAALAAHAAARAAAKSAAAFNGFSYRRTTAPIAAPASDDEGDDNEEDADGYESDNMQLAYSCEEQGDEEDGEFNADITAGRRRGDKGIW